MNPTFGVRMAAGAMLAASLSTTATAQTPRDSMRGAARDEAVYAKVIETLADSAIHRLDFFPTRSQTRVQMLFLSANDSVSVLFADLGRRSIGAALAVDQMLGRFGTVLVPDDLHALHTELTSALTAARAALDRLSSAATGCQMGVSSVQRCQVPFTSASTAVTDAYKRYLDARLKIREQIRDTQTDLAEFRRPK